MQYFSQLIILFVEVYQAVQLFFSYPIELAKCKFQMQFTEIYIQRSNRLQTIDSQNEGFKSLFRGMCVTQQRDILGYSAQLAVFELIKFFLYNLSQKQKQQTANLLILEDLLVPNIGQQQDVFLILTHIYTIKIIQKQQKTHQVIYKVRFYGCVFS